MDNYHLPTHGKIKMVGPIREKYARQAREQWLKTKLHVQ